MTLDSKSDSEDLGPAKPPWLQEERERAPCLPQEQAKSGSMLVARRRVLVDALMMCWGMGSWLGVNGLYLQMPLLVNSAPEGWALPTAMVVAVQLANVAPLLYALVRRLRPAASEAPFVLALLAAGALALLLNAFVYDRTLPVAGADASFAFLALTFAVACVGCGSSVLFYPYLRHFREVYLVTYLVGEGLSGLVPSVLALAQGGSGEPQCRPAAGGGWLAEYPPPRFSVGAFMALLAALGALSLAAFALLDSPLFRSERVEPASAAKDEEATAAGARLASPPWLLQLSGMALLSGLMNGAMPSVQSYSCKPYGAQAYHLAAVLGAVANPAACLAGVWLRPLRPRALLALLAATALPLGYVLGTAALSPAPPLAGAAGGATLVVLAWAASTAGVSYARMWLFGRARAGGARGMRACGAAAQAGSALGSLLLVLLVRYTDIFVEKPPCPPSAAPLAALAALANGTLSL